jgi:hypothetical protein
MWGFWDFWPLPEAAILGKLMDYGLGFLGFLALPQGCYFGKGS